MTARLHHTSSSYYSAIARLALVERSVAFESIPVDIHRKKQQLEPSYARINPNLSVPALELDDGRVLVQSRDILLFAFDTTEAQLDESSRGWVDRHYGFEIEDVTFGWLLSWNPLARRAIAPSLAKIERRIRELAVEHPDLADVYTRRADVFAKRVATFDPATVVAMYDERRRTLIDILDALDAALTDGRDFLVPSIGYGPADVVMTALVARVGFIRQNDELERRPALLRYVNAMKARPSFRAADLWDRIRPMQLLKQML